MKKPRKPTEPVRPVIPDPPKPIVSAWTHTFLFSMSNDDRMSSLDFATKVRQELERVGLVTNTSISFRADVDDDISYGVEVYADVEKQVKNPRYDVELKIYNKHSDVYSKQRAKYERDLVTYKDALARYHADLERYNAWEKQSEIERLEARLAELKRSQ